MLISRHGPTLPQPYPAKEVKLKKILVLSVLFLVMPALALAGSTVKLPDYEKEAKIILRLSCDNGKTKVVGYEKTEPVGNRYYVEITKTESGTTFYVLESEKEQNVFYFTRPARPAGSDLVQMSSMEWMKKLETAAPESHRDLLMGENNCKKEKSK